MRCEECVCVRCEECGTWRYVVMEEQGMVEVGVRGEGCGV